MNLWNGVEGGGELQSGSRYRIVRLIKRGGTSILYEALLVGHGDFERRVTLKRMLPAGVGDDLRTSLADEARIVGHLHHANIVSLLDFGFEGGLPFLVLDYVDGVDLSTLVELGRTARERVPPEIAVHVAWCVAHGLSHAHQARDRAGRLLGIVHRDVNPNNILVSWGGEVRITDFGIALVRERASKTAVGSAKGTLHYMAPEQQSGNLVDGRADIFALGCVLHWMLYGRSPLERQEPSTAPTTIDTDPAFTGAVSEIIERATRLRRSERYPDAMSMVNDCWKALSRRLAKDGRATLVEWLGRIRPSEASPSPQPRLMGLFDPVAIRSVIPDATEGPPDATEDEEVSSSSMQSAPVPENDPSTLWEPIPEDPTAPLPERPSPAAGRLDVAQRSRPIKAEDTALDPSKRRR